MTPSRRDFLWTFFFSLPISAGFSFLLNDFHWAIKIGLAIGGSVIAGFVIANDFASAREWNRQHDEWAAQKATQERAAQAPWDALSAMGRQQLDLIKAKYRP